MIKTISVCIALIVLWAVNVVSAETSTATKTATTTTASTATTQNPLIGTACPGNIKDGYHADAKDPNKYYRCLRGKIIAASHCDDGLIWDETQNSCARPSVTVQPSVHCPEPNGTFPLEGNVHKFIVCSEGLGYIVTCPGDLIFNVTSKICDFNDRGIPWPSDPPTKSTVTGHTGTGPTTAGPGHTTVGTTCDWKGNKPDPNDKHSYLNCHSGKLLHQTCPDGEVYNEENKDCE